MRHIKIILQTLTIAVLFLVPAISSAQEEGSDYNEYEALSFVYDLMSKMTIEEKIGQLNLLTPGGAVTGSVVSENVEEKIKTGRVGGLFGIRGADRVRRAQTIAIEQSRLNIPLIFGLDVIHGHQTVFPIPLGMSCSWDPDLIERTSRQAAREATADGIVWNFSPMVDIGRDPRWGRIAEGAGEDPFLGSEIARAMVRGYQGDDLSDPETMLACVKHYAAYGAPEGGRDYGTVDMSRVKLHNEYLPPYHAAVEAGVASVMTAFNVVDYVPASANTYIFQDVLRDRWDFNGFVVTDYTAINEMIEHGLGDLQKVSALALKAGIDMDMVGEGMVTTLKKSLDEGMVTEDEIEEACKRVLLAKYKAGLFEDPFRYCDEERAEREMMSESNRQFAREVASQSCVLLKNENNVLPIEKKGTIALIGPLADSRENMLGTWSVSGNWRDAVTLKEAFEEALGDEAKLLYTKGANISDDTTFAKRANAFKEEISIDARSPEEMIDEAIEIANRSDVVVVAVGESANMSGESSSLADIGLRTSQLNLLKALEKTGKPIVMVLFNGRPMVIPWEAEHMDAILNVWFGGTEGARGMADVIFGDVNPSAKLTTSFPIHIGQIPVYHSMLNTGRPYRDGERPKFRSNYLDIPNEPLFPFGYGLSYTSFEYGPLQMSGDEVTTAQGIRASVDVTNTGNRTGKEVVQLYIRDLVGSISRPVKELKGFDKITLEPGETKTVEFIIDEPMLRFYNSDIEYVSEAGEFHLFVGSSSEDVQEASFKLTK